MKQHRIEVHGKVEIWTEDKHAKVKKNEFALYNFHDCASDVRLILDKDTKKNVDKFPGYRSEAKYLGEVGEHCEICGVFVPGFKYQGCCDGRECGCMGKAIEPCVCSEECWNKILKQNKEV